MHLHFIPTLQTKHQMDKLINVVWGTVCSIGQSPTHTSCKTLYGLRAQLACFGNWATSRLLKHKRINLIKSFGSLNPSMPQRYSEIITPVLVELSKRWSKSRSSSLWHNSSRNLFGHPLSLQLQDSTCLERLDFFHYLQRTCFSQIPDFFWHLSSGVIRTWIIFILDSLLYLSNDLKNTSDECWHQKLPTVEL